MKLYYAPGACSLAPNIALCEAEADFALVKVAFGNGRTTDEGDDYYAVNPTGAVPALRLGSGELLTENAAILQFIADHSLGKALLPPDGMRRYHALERLNFIATDLHKGFSLLFNPGFDADAKALFRHALNGKLDILSKMLATEQFFATDFGIVDCYAFAVLGWAPLQQIDLTPWPNLRAFIERVFSRESVQRAMSAEGLLG